MLGDLMLVDNVQGIKLWNQLVGKKHVILGNHDTDARIELYKHCHDTVVEGFAVRLKYEQNSFFLSHYPSLVGDKHEEGKPLKNCVINLCGHVHTKDKFYDWDKGLIYHVEIDAHENKPISIEKIIEDIRKRLPVK